MSNDPSTWGFDTAQIHAGEQSRALRHIFFSEREVQRIIGMPDDVKPLPVANVVVIGAGARSLNTSTPPARADIPAPQRVGAST